MASKNPDSQKSKTRSIGTTSLFLGTALFGGLAAASLFHEKLYSPIGILAPNDSTPNFYIGISVYITIAVTLFTSGLIRLGLDLSK